MTTGLTTGARADGLAMVDALADVVTAEAEACEQLRTTTRPVADDRAELVAGPDRTSTPAPSTRSSASGLRSRPRQVWLGILEDPIGL